jgi:hypothetical protein
MVLHRGVPALASGSCGHTPFDCNSRRADCSRQSPGGLVNDSSLHATCNYRTGDARREMISRFAA